jgi:hypothetical protein
MQVYLSQVCETTDSRWRVTVKQDDKSYDVGDIILLQNNDGQEDVAPAMVGVIRPAREAPEQEGSV